MTRTLIDQFSLPWLENVPHHKIEMTINKSLQIMARVILRA